MAIEIERKWLINKLPKSTDVPLEADSYSKIIQGYFNTDGKNTTRIRVFPENQSCILTIKGKAPKGKLGKPEYEYTVSDMWRDHKALLALCGDNVIHKDRYYCMTDDGHNVELDVFKKNLKGLIIAEIEFESEWVAKAFVPPKWFGKEVTKDKVYTNKRLSVNQCVPFVPTKEL